MHAFQTTHYLNNTTSIGIANLHVHLISFTLYLILRHVLQNKNSKTTTKHSLSPKIVRKQQNSFISIIPQNLFFTINCHVRIHKFSQENEAGKEGSRDNCVWHGGQFQGLFVGILLCEIIIFEYCGLKIGKEFCLSFQTRSSRSAHASIKLIIVSQTLGMKNYEIIFAHA